MATKWFQIVGAYDEFSVVWSLCGDPMDYHNAMLSAGRVALENDEPGFYVSTFESARTNIGITVFHWVAITPLDTALLANSLDEYLDRLEVNGIDLNFDDTMN